MYGGVIHGVLVLCFGVSVFRCFGVSLFHCLAMPIIEEKVQDYKTKTRHFEANSDFTA